MKLARSYADALLLALPASERKPTYDGLGELLMLWQCSEELRMAVTAPNLPNQKRIKILEELLSRLALPKMAANLIRLLAVNKRLQVLDHVIKTLLTQLRDLLGLNPATVTSAKEYAAADRKRIQGVVEAKLGKKVEIEWQTDSTLIGGFVIQSGFDVFDCSIKAQLDVLGSRLSSNQSAAVE